MSRSKKRHLHIVSFDVPYPPNYGGVIDVFYKLKALNNLGIQITLHTWQYGERGERAELEPFCKSVFYYKRNRFMNPFSGKLPYIVKTRFCQQLVQNLNVDDSPVLFEGLHTTAPLYNDLIKPSKRTVVRNHNIESEYYRLLAEKETKPLKRAYLKHDAKLLEAYEQVLDKADFVAAISQKDHEQLSKNYNSIYIPAFHPNENVSIKLGRGDYCLYHGNLAVAENSEAALWLVDKVFSKLKVPFIIAGNTAPAELKKLVSNYNHIEIKEQLEIAEFDSLIQNAALNILPTFQPTGIKLKLLNALFKGRFCLVNEFMVHETGLEQLTQIANTPNDFIKNIEKLMGKEFTQTEIEKRNQVLQSKFSNQISAHLLVECLF